MNEREIGAYRRITAPPALKTRLLTAAAASRPRRRRRPMAAAAAACLALTLLFALIGSRAPAVVTMDGQVIGAKEQPVTSAAAARSPSTYRPAGMLRPNHHESAAARTVCASRPDENTSAAAKLVHFQGR